MKGKSSSRSLLQLGLQTWQLLSREQRIKTLRNIVGSLSSALLEVFSLAAIIPFLFALAGDKELSILDNFGIRALPSWQITLLMIISIIVVKNVALLLISRYQSQYIHEIFVSLSEQLYHRFYHQTWLDQLQQNSAETLRKIKHVPSDFTDHVLQGFLLLITDLAICLLMTGVLIWFDYQIVLVIAALSLPIIAFYGWFRKNILTRMNRGFRELTPRANVIMTQGIDSFSEARIYGKENYFIDHFMELNRTTSQYLANLKSATNIPPRLFELAGILCLAAVITYSKIYTEYQEDLIVLLGLFAVAMYRIMPSLNRMLISLSRIQAYSYSVSELTESFHKNTNDAKTLSGKEALTFNGTISLKDVSFGYSDITSEFLLECVNLNIHKGDFVVIEGPSGVGKTTLLHLLTGLIRNYRGKILIDDQVIYHHNLRSWQSKLGYVPQASVVLQGTILENVAFGAEPHDTDMNAVHQAIELSSLADFVDATPEKLYTSVAENGLTLSGGQRQRLVLARALYRKPEVLLLDEVTNQLDESTKHKVLSSLRKLSENGTTIILASHDPVVRKFATRVVHLKEKHVQEISNIAATGN